MTAQQASNFIKHLQRRPTAAETKFWRRCRNQKIGGYDFRKHHVFLLEREDARPLHFIVDFYCSKRKLAIELSGPGPLLSTRNYQARLEQVRQQHEVQILHFNDTEVLAEWTSVASRILEVLEPEVIEEPSAQTDDAPFEVQE